MLVLVLLADAGASGTCEHLRTLVNDDQGSKPWTHSRTGTLTYMFEELLSKIPTSRAPSQNTDPFAALEPPSRAAVALGMLWDPGLQRLCNFLSTFHSSALHLRTMPPKSTKGRDIIATFVAESRSQNWTTVCLQPAANNGGSRGSLSSTGRTLNQAEAPARRCMPRHLTK